jgi:hypothetical protein
MADDAEISAPGARISQVKSTPGPKAVMRVAALELSLTSMSNMKYGLDDEFTSQILKRAERFYSFLTAEK